MSAPYVAIWHGGAPRGKGRPRFAFKTGHAYTDKATADYEAMLKSRAAIAMEGKAIITAPAKMRVIAYFAIPTSWSAKKRALAIAGKIRPTKKPDIDNIVKFTDAFNTVVWVDDVQVVKCLGEKWFGERPGLSFEIWLEDGECM